MHLFVHVTQATLDGALGGEVARVETKTGGAGRPTLAQQVATWCGRPETDVKVTQVIDLNHPSASTATKSAPGWPCGSP